METLIPLPRQAVVAPVYLKRALDPALHMLLAELGLGCIAPVRLGLEVVQAQRMLVVTRLEQVAEALSSLHGCILYERRI